MATLTIPVPDFSERRALENHFRRLITTGSGDVTGDLVPALNLDLPNRRATVDSVEVDDVVVESNGDVQIDYTVHHSTYNGCRDMLAEDSYSEAIFGKRVGNDWVFEEHVTPEPLSPNEEL